MAHFHPTGYPLSILLIIFIMLPHPAVVAEAEPNATPPTKPEAPATELHELKNADLLAQAENTLTQAVDYLSSQIRALTFEDHRYQQAKQVRLALEPPDIRIDNTLDLLQQARHKADLAQAQETYVQDRQKRIEDEKALLEAWVQHNKAAQQAFAELFNTIESLRNGALLEMELRVQDGTLASMPKHLKVKALDKIVRTTKPQQIDLQKALEQRQQDLQAISALHQESKQAVAQAQQQAKAMQQDYQQALKRRELEQLYAGQSAQQRASVFADLQEERVWLQGSLRLSQAKFATLAAQVNPLSTPKEQDQAQDSASGDSMAAYDESIRQLQRQKAALDELVKFAPVVRADLDLVRTHLFKMLVLAQQDDAQAQQVDELAQALQQVQDDTQQINQALVDGPQQAVRLTAQIEQASQRRDRIQAELAAAARKQSAVQQDKEREAHLKTLDDQQLVQYFIDTQKAVQEQEQNKQAQVDKLEQAQQQVDTTRNQMQAIKDSLIRIVEQQAIHEKVNILQTLHELAGLQAPPAPPTGQNASATQANESKTIVEVDNAKKDPVKLNRYENRLAARLRTMQEHQQKRSQLLEAFNALQQTLQEQATHLTDARQKRFDLYAAAVELRKRLGQGSLARDNIPDGVINALQPDFLTRLESSMADLANQQARTGQYIQRLSASADPDTELREKVQAIRMLVGKRIDIFDDLYRLQDSVALGSDDLPKSAQKTLQQTAIRRMESEDSISDMMLRLVPSQRAQSILELLQSYYAELIHLEGQQDSLAKQKAQTKRLIEYARLEQQALREMIPLLKSRLERQKQARDAYDTSVRIQLAPNRATEIIQNYQQRTGQTLNMPKPLPEARREQAIPGFADTLFDYHIRILAARQWITQLEERLTAGGIDFEIEHYRDTLNQVDDHSARIQRRIQYLSGYAQNPPDTTTTTEPEQATQQKSDTPAPDNKAVDLSLTNGQIDELRNDLQQTRMQGALSVVYQIVVILLVAAFLIWLINHFMGKMIQRASTPKADETVDQHAVLAWIAVRSIAKVIVQITALIMILSSFGFQVGAILAGLGIGGLAVAMAAKESLSNILAGVMIFLDKPFTVGDVIKVGSYTTAKVESIGWRTTSVASPFGHYTYIPNSEVAEKPVTNYTKLFPAGDFISVFVSHAYDPDRICELMNEALEQCTAIEQDSKGVMIAGVKVIHQDAWMEYWPWWQTKNYHKRNGQREQVWYHIWKVLTKAGISFTRSDGSSAALLPAEKG